MTRPIRCFIVVCVAIAFASSLSAQGLKNLVRATAEKENAKPAVKETPKPQPQAKRESAPKPKSESRRTTHESAKLAEAPVTIAVTPLAEEEPVNTPPTLLERVESLEQRVDAASATIKETEARADSLDFALDAALKQIANLQTPKSDILPSIKVGFLAQFHGQAAREQTTAVQDANPTFERHWQRQLYVRRLRVLVGGNVTKNTSFFFESDATNIGRVGNTGAKSTTVQMYVQDAQVQHVFSPEFSLIAGLQLVGITRNGLQSAASLLALNYGSYQFITSGALDNNVGRDLGVNTKGFLFDERFEYRLGVFSGRNINQYSPFRGTLRLNYAFRDKEKGLFYSGTTLGKGDVLSVGGGIDLQGTYRGYALDAFADMPVSSLGSLTASGGISFFDGGGSDNDSTYFTGLIPRQRVLFSEVGFFFKELGVQPYLKYESQRVNATVLKQVNAKPNTLGLANNIRSSSRFGIGVNYFLSGHGASVKLLHEFVYFNRVALDPTTWESASTNELTLQFQYFTF